MKQIALAFFGMLFFFNANADTDVRIDRLNCKAKNGITFAQKGDADDDGMNMTVNWGGVDRSANAGVLQAGDPDDGWNAYIDLVMSEPLAGDVEQYIIRLKFNPAVTAPQTASGVLQYVNTSDNITELTCKIQVSPKK